MMSPKIITNQKHLLAVLGLTQAKLDKIIGDIPNLYKPYIKKEIKKDGKIKEREICPSLEPLKTIQKRIKERILDLHTMPVYVQGSIKGKDSISNAAFHKGKAHKFCLDLKNFFPSVRNSRVNRVLLKLGYSPQVAHYITKLITFNNTVPQGAPTSSAITNLVFHTEVDLQIERLIDRKGITYTRYVDDLNFSSQNDFKEIKDEIVKLISSLKFKLSRNKTYYKVGAVNITGVEVGQNVLRPTKKLKEKLKDQTRSEASIAGIQNHIKRIKTQSDDSKRRKSKLIGLAKSSKQ